MPEGQVLEFSGITKHFGTVSAVSDFSARVEPGQVTGFLGPNGAGKTTTLRMLLGLVRPTSGSATIGGVGYGSLRLPLQTVGAVLEASSFHPGRTAANHLKVYAQAAGLPLARVEETLGLVGLADVGGRKVGGFSLGMRQRLGLAYALLGDPGVLVLDEPANGLDPEGIKWMRGFLRRLAREGRTVFVSSHMLAEVQQTVDSVLIISRGRLVFQGSLEDLADPAEFATVVDSPDRAGLSAALKAADVSFELLRSGLTVRGLDPAGVGLVAASAGVALSSLQRRGPALEEIFLDLVSGARVHSTAAPVDGVVPMVAVEGVAAASGATGAVTEPVGTPEAVDRTDAVDVDAGHAAAATETAAVAADLDAGSRGTPGASMAAGAAAGAAAWAAAHPDDESDAAAAAEDAPQDESSEPLAPAPPAPATFAVASTGVIDIVPFDAGNPATDAYQDDLPLDADPDVEALGAIDAELSDLDLDLDGDANDDSAEIYDTAAAVESGELGSEGPDNEVPLGTEAIDEDPVVDDRPWEQYVKTDADVEADAFFAAFTAESDAAAAANADASPQAAPDSADEAGTDAAPEQSEPESGAAVSEPPEPEASGTLSDAESGAAEDAEAVEVIAAPSEPEQSEAQEPEPARHPESDERAEQDSAEPGDDTSELGTLADLSPDWVEQEHNARANGEAGEQR